MVTRYNNLITKQIIHTQFKLFCCEANYGICLTFEIDKIEKNSELLNPMNFDNSTLMGFRVLDYVKKLL